MMQNIKVFLLGSALSCFGLAPGWCGESGSTFVELNKLSFFHGREYYVLRSGRARMVVQADRADLGPALTYLLFDARDASQSRRKEGAINFDAATGWTHSALEVKLGGFAFTALGHRTETRWRMIDGCPTVEAVWWAGGVHVTERIAALGDRGTFLRTIFLDAASLTGGDAVTLRLRMPPGRRSRDDGLLLWEDANTRLGLTVLGDSPRRMDWARNTLEIGPLSLRPDRQVSVEALLLVDIPRADGQAMADRAKELLADQAAKEKSITRARWALASSVATQDRTVQEIFDKSRFGLLGMIADDGTMDAGLFEYGAQWVRDSSVTALGALHSGHFELARGTLERLLSKMITKDGVTMIAGGYDSPDLEQFDQMGELLHLLRAYRDWTGDDSLVRRHRALLLTMIERPLLPQFRDETGMVHNRREFWERTFRDAYELAYQTYLVLGLREAAELAPSLGAEDRAASWRKEADRTLQAMLSHPTRSLVQDGRLIKRRNVTGEVADDPASFPGLLPDAPLRTERHHRLMPDSSLALPIFLRIVDPRCHLARCTLDDLEGLWNTRWSDGGYDRYNTTSEPDQPGAWFTATLILRAQHEAEMWNRSRRCLEWLNTCPGGRAGAWFEQIPSNRSQMKTCGIIPWASSDLAVFVVRHYLGVSFENGQPIIRPALFPNSPPVSANLRFRRGRMRLDIDGGGPVLRAWLDGKELKPDPDGTLRLPRQFEGGTVVIHAAQVKTSPPVPGQGQSRAFSWGDSATVIPTSISGLRLRLLIAGVSSCCFRKGWHTAWYAFL
jgi:hypothetical protein